MCYGDHYRRQLSMELNPGLNGSLTPPPGVGIVHVRALGQNDTLHFLLCSHGAPALLLVHTNSTSSSLQINWNEFLNRSTAGSVRVAPQDSVQYSRALVLTRLWEYDDVNDTADPNKTDPSSFFPPYELASFTWDDLNKTVNLTDHTVRLCGKDSAETFNSNSSFCLLFSAYEGVGREEAWPALLHNANSSQLRLWLDRVTPRSNASRFLFELQSVGSPRHESRVDVLKSIDDEYTPSIFQVSQWVFSPPNANTVMGYTQWKPVAYRKAAPLTEDATPCKHSPPVAVDQASPSGLVLAYFGKESRTFGLNMTFGIKDAPYYNATYFLSWTVLVGMGSPPVEFFSPLVMAIMAIGLGAPLAFILFGGIYVCVRKRRAEPSGYEPIN
ncbi:glycosylated lysosomal membrane protein [Chanos chanos]|uniref:Glycosylated lysosomal membrane protein n=1 Tax=Chanos chanos TaxID=29144 RepID=A0A6J2WHZ0_CHACN|nr:glycosylated lysosomal membrane protein [Chanos chanos]